MDTNPAHAESPRDWVTDSSGSAVAPDRQTISAAGRVPSIEAAPRVPSSSEDRLSVGTDTVAAIRAATPADAASQTRQTTPRSDVRQTLVGRAVSPEESGRLSAIPTVHPRIISPVAPWTPTAMGQRAAESQLEGPASELPPAVHVTIGRIEVRAVMEQPPPHKRTSSPMPKLSLDDYLKQRNRNKR